MDEQHDQTCREHEQRIDADPIEGRLDPLVITQRDEWAALRALPDAERRIERARELDAEQVGECEGHPGADGPGRDASCRVREHEDPKQDQWRSAEPKAEAHEQWDRQVRPEERQERHRDEDHQQPDDVGGSPVERDQAGDAERPPGCNIADDVDERRLDVAGSPRPRDQIAIADCAEDGGGDEGASGDPDRETGIDTRARHHAPPSRARRRSADRSGLEMKPRAAARRRRGPKSDASRLETSTTSGGWLKDASCSATMKPVTSGSMMSSSTSCGRRSRAAVIAEDPSAASPSTTNPSDSSRDRVHDRKPAWSSTIRTVFVTRAIVPLNHGSVLRASPEPKFRCDAHPGFGALTDGEAIASPYGADNSDGSQGADPKPIRSRRN